LPGPRARPSGRLLLALLTAALALPPAASGHAELGYHLYAVAAHVAEPPAVGFPLTVIDSGIDVANPDFAGRADVVQLNRHRIAGTAGSEYHGTAVASVAAAATNGIGTEGVSPHVAIRSFDLGTSVLDPESASRRP
jgi:subtilisin family serine protease